MKFFRYGSAFWRVTERIFDIGLLNLLWLLTSLPLVTIGASSAALAGVSMQLARGEEPAIVRSFFAAFHRCWKTASAAWLMSLPVLGWLAFGVFACSRLQSAVLRLCVIPEGALLALGLLTFVWVFPVCAEYPDSAGATLKRAAYLSLLHLPWTCLMALTAAVPTGLTLFVPRLFPLMLMFWPFLGAGGIAFAQAQILKRLFLRQSAA